LDYLVRRRASIQTGTTEDVSRVSSTLAGLALSGGGLRAATVALGFLQGLARRGLLARFDLLSTISGGGYIGGCLTSLFSDEPDAASATRAGQSRWSWSGLDMGGNFPLGDAAAGQLHHLRAHGNLVIGSLGMFRRDTLRALGTVIRGTVGSLLFFAAVLAVVMSLFAMLTHVFVGSALFQPLAEGNASRTWTLVMGAWDPTGRSFVRAMAVGMVYTLVRFAVWKRELASLLGRQRRKPRSSDTAEDAVEKVILQRHAFSIVILVILTGLAMSWIAGGEQGDGPRSVAWVPTGIFLGALLGGLLAEAFASRRGGRRTAVERSFAAALLGLGFVGLGACLLAAALLPFAAWLGSMELSSAWTLATTLVTAPWLARWLGKQGDGGPPSWQTQLTRRALLPSLAVVTLLLGAGLLLHVLASMIMLHGSGVLYVTLGSAISIVGLLSYVNYDALGPHGFYRDRLAEAYLTLDQWEDGPSESTPPTDAGERSSGGPDEGGGPTPAYRALPPEGLIGAARVRDRVRDHRELRLCKALGAAGHARGGRVPPAPYHILGASLNVPGASHVTQSRRRAIPFFFSPLWCGSALTGFVRTREYWNGRLTLAQAMAVSGAAVSSVLGWFHTASRAFFLTLFNIRLGMWLPNPAMHSDVEGRPGTAPARATRDGEPSIGPLPWLRRMLAECTGTTHAEGAFVNLSDGAHAGDNLGLVALVQRRCRLIVVLDAENDPGLRCGSLASAIRQCLVDENVDVQLGLPALLASAGSRTRTQIVEGTVRYPVATSSAVPPGPEEGRLIYIKLALNDDGGEGGPSREPVVVASRSRSDDRFPHTPTYDLAYDEEQFEAYRAIGEYLALRLRSGADVDHCGEPATPVVGGSPHP